MELMKRIPDKSIDMILCDLPYGTTAIACKQTNRKFIGIELNQEYVNISNERLKQKTVMEFNPAKKAGEFTKEVKKWYI